MKLSGCVFKGEGIFHKRLMRVSGRGVWFVFILVFCFLAVKASGAEGRIVVDASRKGPQVNPYMYGIFYEEINNCGDGGIYAELVRNRSFEDSRVPEGMYLKDGVAMADRCRDKIPWPPEKSDIPYWQLISRDVAAGTMYIDNEKPLNSAQVNFLRLEIKNANQKSPLGLSNSGYWGMAFEKGAKYNLSLYARREESFEGTLKASLEDKNGKAVSSLIQIGQLGKEWKRFACTLSADSNCFDGRLAIYADGPGTIWLDMVSLFPEKTYKGRTNGFRTDLVEILKDLKPAFMRFPGGCITEGLTLEQGYHWKKTIGDIAERPGIWNSMWGYRRTDGLGFHEYLQLCEDIGAVPVYCLNVGVACTIHTSGVACPMPDMQKYVDDALDAIEYANGPVTSKWGALRAKNGHPEPFSLKYINIGNELHGPIYAERYPLFYNAIKSKYPDIQTIAYGAIGKPAAPIEIIDLHDYRDPAWFISNMNRFDNYDRKGPKVACMELAVRNTPTNHTLYSALLEAAYMIGLERNADVVKLVSYAPLFMNTNSPRWEPDLIHFNNHQVYGSPSYYVQQMFMTNRPDVVLKTEVVADKEKKFADCEIGFGVIDTAAEFKDFEVTGNDGTVYKDLGKSLAGWDKIGGDWKLQDDAIQQSQERGDFSLFLKNKKFSDCTLSLKAKKISGTNGFKIYIGSFYGYSNIIVELGGERNSSHCVRWNREKNSGKVKGSIDTGRWYDIKVQAKNGSLTCWLDGKQIISEQLPSIPAVYALAGLDSKSGEIILKAVNLENTEVSLDVNLQNFSPASLAAQTILTSKSVRDRNSFESPKKVVPVTRPFSITDPIFTWKLAPNSFSVLRLLPQ